MKWALLALFAASGCAHNLCDLDRDGGKKWDEGDFAVFNEAFNAEKGDENYNKAADANRDGVVDARDFALFNEECGG